MNHSWKCPSENWPAPILFLGVIVRMTRHKSLLRSKIRQLLKENSQFKKSNFELENHLPSIADPIKMRHHLNITIPMGSWSTCSTTRCIRLALTVQDFGLESRGSSWSIMMSWFKSGFWLGSSGSSTWISSFRLKTLPTKLAVVWAMIYTDTLTKREPSHLWIWAGRVCCCCWPSILPGQPAGSTSGNLFCYRRSRTSLTTESIVVVAAQREKYLDMQGFCTTTRIAARSGSMCTQRLYHHMLDFIPSSALSSFSPLSNSLSLCVLTASVETTTLVIRHGLLSLP